MFRDRTLNWFWRFLNCPGHMLRMFYPVLKHHKKLADARLAFDAMMWMAEND